MRWQGCNFIAFVSVLCAVILLIRHFIFQPIFRNLFATPWLSSSVCAPGKVFVYVFISAELHWTVWIPITVADIVSMIALRFAPPEQDNIGMIFELLLVWIIVAILIIGML